MPKKRMQAPSGAMVEREVPDPVMHQRPDPTFDDTRARRGAGGGGGRMSGEFADESQGAEEFEFVQGPGGQLVKRKKSR